MSAPPLTQTLLVIIALQLYCAATLPQPGAEHELPVPDLYYHAWPQVGVDGGPQPQVLRNGKPRTSVNGAVKRNTGEYWMPQADKQQSFVFISVSEF